MCDNEHLSLKSEKNHVNLKIARVPESYQYKLVEILNIQFLNISISVFQLTKTEIYNLLKSEVLVHIP